MSLYRKVKLDSPKVFGKLTLEAGDTVFVETSLGKHGAEGYEIIVKRINRNTGMNFMVVDVAEEYRNSYGSYISMNAFDGDKRLRFNTPDGDEIVSVDIWFGIKTVPDITLDLQGYGIFEVLGEISDYLQGKMVESKLAEAKTKKVTPSPEKMIPDGEKMEMVDPQELIFQQLSDTIKMVGMGVQNSAIIRGMSGVGKTKTVKDTVKKLGLSYSYTNAVIESKNDFYKILYKENERGKKIIIFDDVDNLLKKEQSFPANAHLCHDYSHGQPRCQAYYHSEK
jgi:hypothetical protein